jgi:hypothetical protein
MGAGPSPPARGGDRAVVRSRRRNLHPVSSGSRGCRRSARRRDPGHRLPGRRVGGRPAREHRLRGPSGDGGHACLRLVLSPPTHPLEFPDSVNLVDLVVYLGVSVLLGGLAAHAVRRAVAAERARGEIADEQAALRRVAMLVVRGAAPAETFGFVAAEIGRLYGAEVAVVFRYDPDRTGTVVGLWSVPGGVSLRARRRAHRPCASRLEHAGGAARYADQPRVRQCGGGGAAFIRRSCPRVVWRPL